jgi:hypothetical protein
MSSANFVIKDEYCTIKYNDPVMQPLAGTIKIPAELGKM